MRPGHQRQQLDPGQKGFTSQHLTEREDEPSPAQAMTPSLPAGERKQATSCPPAAEQPTARATGSQETPEEESLTDDGMEVDYF